MFRYFDHMYSQQRLDEECLLRAFAQRMTSTRPFHEVVGGDAAAVALVVGVAHNGGCPDCGSAAWFAVGGRQLRCQRCARTLPVFRKTPLAALKVDALRLLAAVHATHVSPTTTTGHGFARQWRMTPKAALALLHRARRALLPMVPPNAAVIDVVLGGCAPDNTCVVAISDDDLVKDRVVAGHIDDEGAPPLPATTKKPARHLPLWLGRLRRWLSEHFRGVSRKHLWLYLAEFTDRHGRVRRLTTPPAFDGLVHSGYFFVPIIS